MGHVDTHKFYQKYLQEIASDTVEIDGVIYPREKIFSLLGPFLTDARKEKINQAVLKRTNMFIPILENIYDQGNISAVFRSCEGMGFAEAHLIQTQEKFKVSARVTRGADDWLNIFTWKDQTPLQELKKRGYQILATSFDNAKPIEKVDFSIPTAVVFGNEKEGVSPEALEGCDGTVFIPMRGFSQSFNISVAAALFFYHVRRELESHSLIENREFQNYLHSEYILRCISNPDNLFKEVLVRRREKDGKKDKNEGAEAHV